MTNTKMKPIPTEYEGTVFRSKSEAVFARSLSLAGCHWQYEPKLGGLESAWNIPPHDWDFHICTKEGMSCFVEYKPSKPTPTYMNNLCKKISQYFTGDKQMKQRLSDLWYDALGRGAGMTFSNFVLSVDEVLRGYGKTAIDTSELCVETIDNFYLVWGSPWNGPNDQFGEHSYAVLTLSAKKLHYKRYSIDDFTDDIVTGITLSDHIVSLFGINERMAQEAKSYRFDLKQ